MPPSSTILTLCTGSVGGEETEGNERGEYKGKGRRSIGSGERGKGERRCRNGGVSESRDVKRDGMCERIC